MNPAKAALNRTMVDPHAEKENVGRQYHSVKTGLLMRREPYSVHEYKGRDFES